jgi:hypothetical protein
VFSRISKPNSIPDGVTFSPAISTFYVTSVAKKCGSSNVLCANGAASALIGAFGWALPYPTGGDPTGATPVKVYLDDIVWDTEPAPL